MSDRTFSDAVADPYDAPPLSFTDGESCTIEVRAHDGSDEELEMLVEMYDAFDPSDRTQGIPPGREDRIRDWLENIFDEDCLNVIAWNDDEVVGHVALVSNGDAYELAIFAHQTYQRAGIGTRLIKALLGYGRVPGVEKVWLTVERWNRAAVGLYQVIGFETSDAESFELEMITRLVELPDDEGGWGRWRVATTTNDSGFR